MQSSDLQAADIKPGTASDIEENMTQKIMFQGTGSNVGKSLLNAAFCRTAVRRGYRTAPYKSQNMALNSYITKDGKEMGRAQVVQAECCRIEPEADMNPILLKPNSDMGSQVIVNGTVRGNMAASIYYDHKDELLREALKAYDRLAEKSDLIVIEGAGSPAEINLRQNDIVNMGLATEIDAPVVLVCDIDKGGVFASLYGTVMLLEPEERDLIKGFIINKFRGDVELLKPGIDMIVDKIGIPCLGVMPYRRFRIDDEDSVAERIQYSGTGGALSIGVIGLSHISNFTDLTVFDMYDDVTVSWLRDADKLMEADIDLLVIPGSKNTVDDMKVLNRSGLADAIRKKAETVPVIGICGGYQLLGREIKDPLGVESSTKSIEGLGLLDTVTELAGEKTTTRISGSVLNGAMLPQLSGAAIDGYEIHMGTTTLGEAVKPFVRLEDGREDGAVSEDGRVMGSYLHGLFDNDGLRNALIEKLTGRKSEAAEKSFRDFKEEQYDLLADTFEEFVDTDALFQIAGLDPAGKGSHV